MGVFKGRIITKVENDKTWTVKIKDDTNNDFYVVTLKKDKVKNLDSFLNQSNIIAYYNDKEKNIPYFFISGETYALQPDKNFKLRKDIGFTASCLICLISTVFFLILSLSTIQYFLDTTNVSPKTYFTICFGVFIFTTGFCSTTLFNFFQKEAMFVKDIRDEFILLSRENRK